MSLIQRIMMAVLPSWLSERVRQESESWIIRCLQCDTYITVWDAGGIRYKAKSYAKRTKMNCPYCGEMTTAAVEKLPEEGVTF